MSVSYKDSGVDLEEAQKAKAEIKKHIASTHSPNVLRDIGLFSGFFSFEKEKYQNPVLVSSIDGVGTKVKIAQMAGIYDTIGEDLVNHCVNDIMVCGADPLFFLDYVAADRLQAEMLNGIVYGMTTACREAKCALVGGETAEMPGVYARDSFDVAGSIVGAVDRDAIIDGSRIEAGDLLLGIPSNGLHTNGYSLVRKIFFEEKKYTVEQNFSDLEHSLGAELLRVHKLYASLIKAVRAHKDVHGIAHITGGGIRSNTARLLPESLDLRIEWDAWVWQPVFSIIQKEGDVEEDEMRNVFNLGIGLVLVVGKEGSEELVDLCKSVGEEAHLIGSVIKNRSGE